MQAGESLSFITIPDELAIPEVIVEDEKEATWRAFGTLVQQLMITHPDTFKSIEQLEESGIVTVIEGSFQVRFADGSYIHIVAYSHSDDEGILDLGLTLVEHSDEGVYLGGYLYEMSGADITCSPLHSSNDEEDEQERKYHFSLLSMYKERNELYGLLLSEDDDQRESAENDWRQVNEAAQLSLIEKELGFSTTTPTLEDIQKIKALVAMASPFTMPETS